MAPALTIAGERPYEVKRRAGKRAMLRRVESTRRRANSQHCKLERTLWYHRGMIRPFLIGFATTFKHMFKKPNTVNYPAEKFPMFPKYRGKQVLMRDEN